MNGPSENGDNDDKDDLHEKIMEVFTAPDSSADLTMLAELSGHDSRPPESKGAISVGRMHYASPVIADEVSVSTMTVGINLAALSASVSDLGSESKGLVQTVKPSLPPLVAGRTRTGTVYVSALKPQAGDILKRKV